MSEPINPDDQRPSQPNPYGQSGTPGEPQPGPYGTPPPPASAYPPAGPTGYPAAPGGYPGGPTPGYAPQDGFPPPPPVSGYGAVPPVTDPADIGQSLGWGWRKFTENAGALIVAHLLWGVGIAIVLSIVWAVAVVPSLTVSSSSNDAVVSAMGGLSIGLSILVGILSFFAVYLSQIGLINGYLAIADGRKATIGDFFTFRNIGQALILGVLVSIASGLLSFTYIGTYVVAFFTAYALLFAIDRNQTFQDAIKSSAQLALKYVLPTILIVLVVYLVAPLGAFVCGVGLLVTVPWANLSLTSLYRRLSGGYVAP